MWLHQLPSLHKYLQSFVYTKIFLFEDVSTFASFELFLLHTFKLQSHFFSPTHPHPFSVWYSHLGSDSVSLPGLPSAQVVWQLDSSSIQHPQDATLWRHFINDQTSLRKSRDYPFSANDLRTSQKICENTDSLCLLSLSFISLKFYYFRLFQNEIFLSGNILR